MSDFSGSTKKILAICVDWHDCWETWIECWRRWRLNIPLEADRKVKRLKSELESEKAGLSGTNRNPVRCVKYFELLICACCSLAGSKGYPGETAWRRLAEGSSLWYKRDMPHLPVLVEIACVAQVQGELKNKNLTSLEEVKLLKAREDTRPSVNWLQLGTYWWGCCLLLWGGEHQIGGSHAFCSERGGMYWAVQAISVPNTGGSFPVQADDKVKRLNAELESEKAGPRTNENLAKMREWCWFAVCLQVAKATLEKQLEEDLQKASHRAFIFEHVLNKNWHAYSVSTSPLKLHVFLRYRLNCRTRSWQHWRR